MKKPQVTLLELMYYVAIIATVIIVLVKIFGGIFVSPPTAVRALETQGFSQVEIVDKDWFAVGLRGCSRGDSAKFEAKAVNPTDKKVDVYVCIGWPFKGATVRSQ